jgi:hypothetical protein
MDADLERTAGDVAKSGTRQPLGDVALSGTRSPLLALDMGGAGYLIEASRRARLS